MTDLLRPTESTLPPAGAAVVAHDPENERQPQAAGNPVRLAIMAGLVALLGLTGGWPLLVVVLGVVVMIFLHELGHYLAAKAGGMKVTEFFIGFGPRIWSFRRGETEYGLKAIPAGAYVKVIGMTNLEPVDPDDESRTYRVKSYPKRLLVAVAGSAMHFAQALVILFVLFAFVGVPGGGLVESDRDWEVREVIADSAAADAGLVPGDEITALDGETMDTFSELRETVMARPGEAVELTIDRDGESLTIPVTIGVSDGAEPVGLLGVSSRALTTTVGPVDAVGSAFREFSDQTTTTLSFMADLFTPSGISDLAGDVADGNDDSVTREVTTSSGQTVEAESPDEGRVMSIIGAVRVGANLTEGGWLGFLVFFAAINITIGIFNLLPLLPLDGGHVVVATYERVREFFLPRGQRYYTDFAKVMPVVYAVLVVLMLLGFSTMYLDIIDPPV